MTAVKRPAAEEAALQQWGPLFMRDRTASPKLDSLLRGIARCISTHYGSNRLADLRPNALAEFYKSVGGDYDQLFKETPSQSLAFIYSNLRCPYSLQPASPITYEDPTIPALKDRGFVIWQTIQLMLGPEEHVPFIQNALQVYDVRNPDTGEPFPKTIPSSAFPQGPDPVMVKWHEDISQRLQLEAQAANDGRPLSRESTNSTEGTIVTINDRSHAAGFFANPLYKNKEGRPAIVKQLSRAPGQVLQGGKSMALNVYQGGKMILSPNLFGGSSRKKSHSRSPSRDRDDRHKHGHRHLSASANRRPSSPLRTVSHETRPRRSSKFRSPSPTTSEEEEADRARRHRHRRHKSQENNSPDQSRDDPERRRRHSVDLRHDRADDRPRDKDSRPTHFPPLAVKPGHRDGNRDSSGRRTSGAAPVRPSAHRANSDHGNTRARDAVRRQGSYDTSHADSDGTINANGRRRGQTMETPTIYEDGGKMSPGTQEEWNGLKEKLGQGQSSGNESGGASAGGRRESVMTGVGGVHGARARRYPNEAPWAN